MSVCVRLSKVKMIPVVLMLPDTNVSKLMLPHYDYSSVATAAASMGSTSIPIPVSFSDSEATLASSCGDLSAEEGGGTFQTGRRPWPPPVGI